MTAPRTEPHGTGLAWLRDRNAHLQGLTKLRAIAAMWVVVFHYRDTIEAWIPGSDLLDPLMAVGFLGVDLFFALSGFVIAHRYLTTMGPSWRWKSVRDFLLLRFARLYPVHLFMICIFGAYLALTSRTGQDTGYDPNTYGWGPLLQNLTLVHGWFNQVLTWNGPAWSISVEWMAYLAFPAIAIAFYRIDRGGKAVAIAVAVWVLAYLPLVLAAIQVITIPFPGEGPFGYSIVRITAGFVGGVAAFVIMRNAPRLGALAAIPRFRRCAIWGVTVVTLIALWAVGTTQPEVSAGGVGQVDPTAGLLAWLTPPLLCLVVAAAALVPPQARLSKRSLLITLGLASYSLYMTHIFVLMVAGGVAGGGAAERLGIATAPSVVRIAFTVCALIGCLVVSVVTYHVVEEPSRKFLRRMVPRADTVPVEARPWDGSSPDPNAVRDGANERA